MSKGVSRLCMWICGYHVQIRTFRVWRRFWTE